MKFEDSNEIKLWDLFDSNVYVKIKSPIREEFFNYLIKISGGYRKLSKRIDTTFGHLFQQKKGLYFTSLNLLNRLLDVCPQNERIKFRNKIENNIEEIKLRSRSSPIKNPNLPIGPSETLARIIGHIVGDGGIKNTLIVHYTNEDSELLDSFRKDVLEIFGDVKYGSYLHKGKENIKTIWFPRIIGLLLVKMIGKQVKRYKHVPRIISEADDDLKSIFLSALFDDEGSIKIEAYSISIMLTGKKLVKDIKNLLKEVGISSGKTSIIESDSSIFGKKYNIRTRYQFYISGKINLNKFGDLINFSHTRKRNDLKILLQKYKTYKSEELKELVLKQLKLNVDGINASEISERLNRKYSGSFRHFLCKLEREGVISSTKRKNLKTYVIK